MREIKFRGKRIDNDEWAYGDLTRYSERMSYITVDLVEGEIHQVFTETVGQYVWCNSSGDFYEGDIFHDSLLENDFTIVFDDTAFYAKSGDWLETLEILDKDSYVIGNIHDRKVKEV